MSDGPSFLSSSDSLHTAESEQNAHIQLEAFQNRLRAFEDALQNAIDAELQFRREMTDALNSLRMLTAEQRSEDARLTDLVQQDTQRSREVMADYDNLASSFRENVQPPDPTRLREAFRTVGIVLSFIFMAPIQAVWWLLTQFFSRLRFGNMLTAIFARLKGTADAPGSSSVAIVSIRKGTSSRPFGRHKRRPSIRSDSNTRNGSDLPLSSRIDAAGSPSATHSPGTQTLPSSIMNGLVDLQIAAARKQSGVNQETLDDSDELEASDGSKLAFRREAAASSSSDVFVDAQTGSLGSNHEPRDERSYASETETSGDRDGRPAWALPLNSESTLPDIGNFPSAEFWHISDEEMKLDFPRISNNLNNS